MIKFVVLLFAAGALGLPFPQRRLIQSFDKPRIVGGNNAYDGQYPYQVSVKNEGNHHCGGSIISERSILSASHCYYVYSPSVFTVVAGTVKLSNTQMPSYKVSAIRLHPYFNPQITTNDVAIVIVATSITYSRNVQPISVNTDFIGPNLYTVLTGWGYTYPGVTPDNLQRIDLTTIDNKQCAQRLNRQIIDSQVCTLAPYGYGACNGDSGGPLVFNGRQMGIVSFGIPCALEYPDVFTRVSSFLDWIQANTV